MPSITTAFANFNRPGVKVVEQTTGYRVTEIAAHQTIYMIGGATSGPYNTPTLAQGPTDFTNQFGGSLSEASVKLLFRNNPSALLYFVRSYVSPSVRVAIDAAAADDYVVTLTGAAFDEEGNAIEFNGTPVTYLDDVTYSAEAGETVDEIATGLQNAINASDGAEFVTATATVEDGEILLRVDKAGYTLTVTAAAGDITIVDETAALTSSDYVAAIENSFDKDDDIPQGFLIAPEAFQYLSASDRLSVAIAMEALCSQDSFDWVALLDCGPEIGSVATAKADGEQYVSPQGHSAYYAPYLLDIDNQVVPPSAAVAAIHTRRFAEQGYQQPGAGASYALKGVKDVTYRFSNQEQEVLNPININLIRNLQNKGVCIWGMRTRSADAFYKFTVTRVIMNVLNGTLRRAYDFALFSSIDGQDVFLSRAEDTANAVCRQMWIGGALFGATAAEAYQVIASRANNSAENLENGNVLVEVYAVPSTASERVLVGTYRVGIGQVQTAANAGRVDVSAV